MILCSLMTIENVFLGLYVEGGLIMCLCFWKVDVLCWLFMYLGELLFNELSVKFGEVLRCVEGGGF